MKNLLKKSLAFFLILALLVFPVTFSPLADSVPPLRIVKYNQDSVISGGYYSSNKTGGLVSTDAANRPGFSTQSISIGGESYYRSMIDGSEEEQTVSTTPLALMDITEDDQYGLKQGTVTAKGGSCWVGGDSGSTVSFDTGRGAAAVSVPSSSGWAALYFDRPYTVLENDEYYVAVLYETETDARFSSIRGYSYRTYAFLPIVDGTARLAWQYDFDYTDENGKSYTLAYARVADAAEDMTICGMQFQLQTNTTYYFHSAGVFRTVDSMKEFYFSHHKTSQQQFFNWDKLLTPVWDGDIVYEESVMVMTGEDGAIDPISLLYPIEEIVSVMDAAKSIRYTEGMDYGVADGKLMIPTGSAIPVTDYNDYYFSEAGDNHKALLDGSGYTYFAEGAYWHYRQIVVTYRHSGAWKGDIPTGQAFRLPKTLQKLKNGEALNIVVNGLSTTTGCNVSSTINAQPYLPNWATMTTMALQRKFSDAQISMVNTAVGGTLAKWGAENVQSNVINYNPDLVFIEFGLNDADLNAFRTNMQSMVASIKQSLSDCEIVLVQSPLANPNVSGHYAYQEAYVSVLRQIADAYDGIAVANVAALHDYMLSIKKYCDMTGNNVNHFNDFMERVYTQVILKVFDDAVSTVNAGGALAYAAYREKDTGSVKTTAALKVDAGSLWAGGDHNTVIDYNNELNAVHVQTTTSAGWVGLQFDNTAAVGGEPYYTGVLFTVQDNVFTRFSNTAGYTYAYAPSTDFNPLSTTIGRLKWRYDRIGSSGGVDYFMAYARVTDVSVSAEINGIQVIVNAGVDYNFFAAGLFDDYQSMVAAFKNTMPSGALSLADYGANTILNPYVNLAGGVAGSICYQSSSASYAESENGVVIQNGTAATPSVYAYFDTPVTVQTDGVYYFGVLVQSDTANELSAAYYCAKNYTGTLAGSTTSSRPAFTSYPVTVNGTEYQLAVSALSMNDSAISDGTVITGLRFLLQGKNVSYILYGAGVFESLQSLMEYVENGGFTTVEEPGQTLAFARFDKPDVGGHKPASGAYLAAEGSILKSSQEGVIEYSDQWDAVHVTAASSDWVGLQFDASVTAPDAPYYAAVLFATGDLLAPFSYNGYSYVPFAGNSFTVLGTNVGRLSWAYRYIGNVGGMNRYMAFARVTDVETGTVLTGMQIPLKSGADYYFYSAGLFENYEGALTLLSDSTAPVLSGTPAFKVNGTEITALWGVASDNLTASEQVVYRLYASTGELSEKDLPIASAKTVGGCTAKARYLSYGSGYYTAVEAMDKAGNKSLWINPQKLYTAAKTGDVNTDEQLDSQDMVLLKRGLLSAQTVEGPYADVNADSECDVRDLVRLKKLLTNADELSFETLGLATPHVAYPAEIVFGTYQNMPQLVENPEEWSFVRQYADGILLHEAYWLNGNSPASTTGRRLSNILSQSDLTVYLEYGMPKSDILASSSDDGTAYGEANAARLNEKLNRFISASGIQVDVVNLELYSGAVTGILNNLGLTKNWSNHTATGVPYLLQSYDAFYAQFVKNFPGLKINHVGCPNLTGWIKESEGGTLPRYWQQHYSQSYWTSYQAYDVTIPIFEKYANDGIHIGWVHDSPWNSFDTGKLNVYGTQDAVVKESMGIICGTYGLASTLLVGDWDDAFGDTVTDRDAIDKFYWENSLKSIYNAQYQGEYHSTYLLESYWDGPYTMVSEDDPFTYANLVKTALQTIKGIGQQLDLAVTDGRGTTTGEGVYGETPTAGQTVIRTGNSETYTVTVTNNGEVACNPWLRAVENKQGATVTYRYNGQDITSAITSEDGFTFKDLFEDNNGSFDSYTSSGDEPLDTHFDEQNHGLKPGASVTVEVTVSGGEGGAVAICGFYNPQDPTDTIKDVVTVRF